MSPINIPPCEACGYAQAIIRELEAEKKSMERQLADARAALVAIRDMILRELGRNP